MNKKQKLAILILSIFIIGICIGAADAAHTVTKGKNKVKISSKEYKKLTATTTKYKNVTKTRTVTKYKNVTKTRTVTKYNTVEKTRNVTKPIAVDTRNNIEVNATYIDNITFIDPKTGQTVTKEITGRKVIEDSVATKLKKEGYVGGGIRTVKFVTPHHLKYGDYAYNEEYDVEDIFCYVLSYDYQNFTKITYDTVEEKYSVNEPYTVEEKYQEKVPYKIRKAATITKNIPKKYRYYWKYKSVYKTVKVPYKIGKWKFVAKSYGIGGIQDVYQQKAMKKRVSKLKSQGWHINWKKQKNYWTTFGYFTLLLLYKNSL